MSFNRTYLLYLTIFVIVPSLITGFLSKSIWLAILVFIVANIVARWAIALFHYLFRWVGDKSEESKLNTSVRLILTDSNYNKSLQRIYPDQDVDFLIATGKTIVIQLIHLADGIDKNQIPETEARMKLKFQFPFLDQGNCNWLNKKGRAFLKSKATLHSNQG
jgi:hypothetical protein